MWIAEKGRDPDLGELIDPAHTALVVIDIQNDFCHASGAFGLAGYDTAPMPQMAARVRGLLEAARRRQLLIVFIRAVYDAAVTSRVLANNRHRRGLKFSLCLEGTWGAGWYDGLEPRAGANSEIVLTKHRFDAFHGTPLDLYLRSNDVRTLVAVGTATSGCVELTVRDAFFHDYAVVVPPDCTADTNAASHRNSLEIIERNYARLVPSAELIDRWRGDNAVARDWSVLPSTAPVRDALVLVDADERLGSALPAASGLLEIARTAGVMVLHVRTQIPAAAVSEAMRWRGASSDQKLERVKGLTSKTGEFEVVKHRASAFADTRLAQLLRTNLIDRIVVVGASALGDVDLTARDGIDRDFAVEIAKDAVGVAPHEMSLAAFWEVVTSAQGVRFHTSKEIGDRWVTSHASRGPTTDLPG